MIDINITSGSDLSGSKLNTKLLQPKKTLFPKLIQINTNDNRIYLFVTSRNLAEDKFRRWAFLQSIVHNDRYFIF